MTRLRQLPWAWSRVRPRCCSHNGAKTLWGSFLSSISGEQEGWLAIRVVYFYKKSTGIIAILDSSVVRHNGRMLCLVRFKAYTCWQLFGPLVFVRYVPSSNTLPAHRNTYPPLVSCCLCILQRKQFCITSLPFCKLYSHSRCQLLHIDSRSIVTQVLSTM